ncbi:MAG: DUF4380 domain-containing protein [Bacteroidales bacterium]|nr:DUF4380 domain-containing protein [Bacteroidales bacterium]
MKIRFLVVIMSIMQTIAQAATVTLSDGRVEVGVAPELGGRVLFIREKGTDGLILADRDIWENPSFKAPEITGEPVFYPFNGITLWIGPQSGWWKNQDYNDELRNKAAGWPPDPFGEYGRFEIIKQEPGYIEMLGPESPVTGLQLLKTVRIMPDGKVKLCFTATNRRSEPVQWDLWVNVRSTPHAKASVKVKSMDDVRIESISSVERDVLSTDFKDGIFSILPELPSKGKNARSGKVFLYPEEPEIVASYKDMCMIIRFDKVPREKIHPEQGAVEFYSHLSAVPDPSQELLELEFHGPYGLFQPGESKSIQCTIELR